MWLFRIKRFLAERELITVFVVFGLFVMAADLFSDIGLHLWISAYIRGAGLAILLLVIIFDFYLRRRSQPFPVPIVLSEDGRRKKSDELFKSFVKASKLASSTKLLEESFHLSRHFLLLGFDDHLLPRQSKDPDVWRRAWDILLHRWEEVDQHLPGDLFSTEGYCYHIVPHLVLPLAFAMGASVALRKKVFLYHRQPSEKSDFYQVMDLSDPHRLFERQEEKLPTIKTSSKNLDEVPAFEKLILHLVISDRHSPNFALHPEHEGAANLALCFPIALKAEDDWLLYVQTFKSMASEEMEKYNTVDMCLICPSVVAFALGMVFSRSPKITVCHRFEDGFYHPVFSLANIEKRPRLPFD